MAGRLVPGGPYLREGGPVAGAAVSFGGDDRLVSDYMESEVLARISRRQRAFLTRTSVLERMSGPLCEVVLDMGGSRATLENLARSNLRLRDRPDACHLFGWSAAVQDAPPHLASSWRRICGKIVQQSAFTQVNGMPADICKTVG